MPSFLIGKRSADNARRFMMDVAGRLTYPEHPRQRCPRFQAGGYLADRANLTDGFAAYPEAVDLAFGPYVPIRHDHQGIQKREHDLHAVRNGRHEANRHTRDRAAARAARYDHVHVERLNGTQRLFMKRLNRLTLCFSKKLENLEAAFAMFAAWYNFCWQTRMPGNSGKLRPTAAMMAGLAGHVWSFDELFAAVLN